VTDENDKFEYLPEALTHKILDKVGDAPVTDVFMYSAAMENTVMSETIATFCDLNIPETGLEKLSFTNFKPPLESLSETVLD